MTRVMADAVTRVMADVVARVMADVVARVMADADHSCHLVGVSKMALLAASRTAHPLVFVTTPPPLATTNLCIFLCCGLRVLLLPIMISAKQDAAAYNTRGCLSAHAL